MTGEHVDAAALFMFYVVCWTGVLVLGGVVVKVISTVFGGGHDER